MVYCIGLTGNLASGKSTVAARFAKLGVDIISADQIAKEITASKQPAFKDIVKHFGESVLTPTGELDRRHVRQLIFEHANERRWLENLLHPLIRAQIQTKIANTKGPYCIIEIPLLSDKTHYPYLNRILVIQANPEQLIERFIARDNGSKEDALAILSTQKNGKTLQALADDVLINTGSMTELQEKIEALHKKYLQYTLKNKWRGAI